jgi:hypothetical protein
MESTQSARKDIRSRDIAAHAPFERSVCGRCRQDIHASALIGRLPGDRRDKIILAAAAGFMARGEEAGSFSRQLCDMGLGFHTKAQS